MITKCRFNFPLLIGVLLLTGSCDELDIFGGGPVCTLIGCSDGINLVLTGEVPESYFITIGVPDGESQRFEITDNNIKSGHHFFGDITAEKVYVTIEAADTTFTEVFEPEYKKFKPNGSKCPPTCMQANLELHIVH
jgi:hypothetical protein